MAEKTGKEFIDEISAIKNGGAFNPATIKYRAAMTGGLIGFAGGAYWAWVKKGNVLIWGIGAGIAGALVARILMPK